jgi:hypothetical protein
MSAVPSVTVCWLDAEKRGSIWGNAICFVDDDPREISRFRKHLSGRFDIGAGSSIVDALDDLRNTTHRKPDVFLLDMYRFEGPTTSEVEEHKLREARAEVLQAEAKGKRALEGRSCSLVVQSTASCIAPFGLGQT